MIFLSLALSMAFIVPGTAHASITNTRVDAAGTLELAGSNWLGSGGVDVYSNGNSAANEWGDNYVGSVKSGIKWQCVEMVNRLYLTKGWTSARWAGNGNTMVNNVPSGLTKQNNGSISYLNSGDVITLDDGGYGHAAVINSVGTSIQIVNQNTVAVYSSASITSGSFSNSNASLGMSGWAGYSVQAVVHRPADTAPPPPPALSRMIFVRGDDMLFAKDSLSGPWVDETGAGWVRSNSATQVGTIAVGGADGAVQLWINGCDALYAKTSLGQGGWTQETDCGTARSVAVSNTNLQMMVDTNGAVWARYGIGVGGWTYEAAPGTATAVAAGGDTQMLLSTCGAVYAKNGVGYGGWTEEAPCGTATQISISSTGLQMILNTCGAFYAKNGVGVGGWWAEGDCGWAKEVAAGGNTHMFLSTNGAVYAKNTMGYGGWVEEAANGTATDIAIGNNGRQVIITGDSSIFARDGIGVGGWNMQAGPGNGKTVAVS